MESMHKSDENRELFSQQTIFSKDGGHNLSNPICSFIMWPPLSGEKTLFFFNWKKVVINIFLLRWNLHNINQPFQNLLFININYINNII